MPAQPAPTITASIEISSGSGFGEGAFVGFAAVAETLNVYFFTLKSESSDWTTFEPSTKISKLPSPQSQLG